ncbi:unnamed protein product [Strongylus vulgaris]|uniref:Uncharacterized protein n=1 Tax=Strongylus vulgaris TaxID=40348 RepID=A0A3P7LD00_STRVU|nr:unnamed protein product [Strongylus vulgaris]
MDDKSLTITKGIGPIQMVNTPPYSAFHDWKRSSIEESEDVEIEIMIVRANENLQKRKAGILPANSHGVGPGGRRRLL